MTRVEGAALAALVTGAAETTRGERGGVVPHRLPSWARLQTDDPLFGFAQRCPAGVTLRFATDAETLRLSLSTTSVELGVDARPHRICVRVPGDVAATPVDLPPGDVVVVGPDLSVLDRRTADPGVVDLVLPAAGGDRVVELLLPHDAPVELLWLEADGELRAAPDDRLRWIHYGSSISHGFEAPAADRTWPQQVADARGWALRNLSFSGNAQLDPFAARVIRDSPADLITLKVGVNLVHSDSMRRRTMLPALHGFLDTIREGHPHTPIILVTAVACPVHEHAPGPGVSGADGTARVPRRDVENDGGALTLETTREVVAAVHAARAADDPHLGLIDGLQLLGADDAHLLPDGVHPSPAGLDLIAERFRPLIDVALGVTS